MSRSKVASDLLLSNVDLINRGHHFCSRRSIPVLQKEPIGCHARLCFILRALSFGVDLLLSIFPHVHEAEHGYYTILDHDPPAGHGTLSAQ
jgi:hypothetical protein